MKSLIDLQIAQTTADFASLIGYKASNITYLLYHYSGSKYYQFNIPKKNGGTRVITAPCDELKELQQRFLWLSKK